MTSKPEYKPDTKKPEMVEFTVNGITVKTSLTKKYRNRRKWIKPDEKKVVSIIPGTICEVFVKKGDNIRENDKLLILEAMKMMNEIHSTVSGKICNILVEPGEKVPKGKVMIEFEQDERM